MELGAIFCGQGVDLTKYILKGGENITKYLLKGRGGRAEYIVSVRVGQEQITRVECHQLSYFHFCESSVASGHLDVYVQVAGEMMA